MKGKSWFIIFCLCLLTLAGCGHEAEPEEVSALPEYYENSLVFRLPSEQCPFTLMGVSDTHFYYYHKEVVESGDGYAENIRFYRQTLEKGSEPTELKLLLENLLLRNYYIATDSEGKDSIYLLLGEEKEGNLTYFIAGYDTDGRLLKEISLQNTEISGDYPDAFVKLRDGSFAVITKKYFFVANADGQTMFSLSCPGMEFRGLAELSDEKISVSYAGNNMESVSLAFVDRSSQALSDETAITGDGNLLCAEKEAIIYVDEGSICRYDPITAATSKVMGLEGRNMDAHQIVDMRASGDTFRLFGYSTDVTAAKYVTYTTKQRESEDEEEALDSEKYDAYGRRYIFLYDYSGDWPKDSTNPVDAFNEQSDTYQVVFKDYGYDHAYDDTYDTAKIVASGDFPDLIFSTYNSLIAAFQEKGCLENLIPYINSSEGLSMEDLSEPVVAAYTNQGSLFALPNCYTLSGLWGDRERLGRAGWTVNEFLDWMAEYPNAGAPLMGTRRAIYDACIPSVMEMCIDWENGKASFDGEEFQSFITKMKALHRKESYTYEDRLNIMEMLEDMNGSAYSLQDAINLNTIAVQENAQGRELAIKGYPGADGSPVIYITSPALSIMSTSEVKDGAYEFLEFYLLYMSDTIAQGMQQGVSSLWTVERYLEQNREALLEADNYMGESCTFSERQLDEVINIIPYAVLKDYSRNELNELIWEELKPFFEGQKDADAVCGIIQSRVQLYLDEHGRK